MYEEKKFMFPYAKFKYKTGDSVYYLRNIVVTRHGLEAEWKCKGQDNWYGTNSRGGFYLTDCEFVVGLKQLPNFIKA
jgi:hypothetical protein